MPVIRSPVIREFLAEFMGVLILCTLGNGSVAQQVISRKNDFLSINLAYGIGVTFGVYVAFGVSGGHINPAVTLSQAVIGKFPWPKVLVFMVAQYLGAFVSSAIVFLIYLDGINHLDGGVRQVGGENGTAGIFASYPQPYVTNVTAFFDQVVSTAILLIGVLALTNEKNVSLRVKSLEPLVIGFLVAAIGMSYGVNCGFPINPARDLAPRVFTAIVGYGGGVFSAGHYYFWVPVVGPHVGAIAGTLLYKLLVGMHFVHDLELLANDGDGGDEAARVGKAGKADNEADDTPPQSPAPVNRGFSRQLTQADQRVLAPQLSQYHGMWRQNTQNAKIAARQNPLTSQMSRHVMWRQNTRNVRGLEGVVNEDIEFADLPEAASPAAGIRDRIAYSAIADSKRPGI